MTWPMAATGAQGLRVQPPQVHDDLPVRVVRLEPVGQVHRQGRLAHTPHAVQGAEGRPPRSPGKEFHQLPDRLLPAGEIRQVFGQLPQAHKANTRYRCASSDGHLGMTDTPDGDALFAAGRSSLTSWRRSAGFNISFGSPPQISNFLPDAHDFALFSFGISASLPASCR